MDAENNTQQEYTAQELELIRKARNEYNRKYLKAWRQRNKDKVNAKQRAYTKAHPEKRREYNRRYWLKRAQQELANTQSEQ
jgi:hypothetical protein